MLNWPASMLSRHIELFFKRKCAIVLHAKICRNNEKINWVKLSFMPKKGIIIGNRNIDLL